MSSDVEEGSDLIGVVFRRAFIDMDRDGVTDMVLPI
jgi:hypothetical protein